MDKNNCCDVLILTVITIFLFAQALTQQADNSDEDLSLERWNQFKERFSKRYSEAEDEERRQQWETNSLYISQHNKEAALGQHTYTLGENQFTDWYPDEYQKMLGYRSTRRKVRRRRQSTYYENPTTVSSLPPNVNWTGWVNPVQYQGLCAAGWAFSACGAMEAAWINLTNTAPMPVLSEQNLIDCSVSEGNDGCDGGNMQLAFEYVRNNGGIDISGSYPYTELLYNSSSGEPPYGECLYNPTYSALKISGWQTVQTENELALQQAVALTGPVSVAIDASLLSFRFYRGGVYSNPGCGNSSSDLNHAVLAVGYGTYKSEPYWYLKNSYGFYWGIDGYMMLARNDNNMCGVATDASFPIPLNAYFVPNDASYRTLPPSFSMPTLPANISFPILPTLPSNFTFPTSPYGFTFPTLTAEGYTTSTRNQNGYSASERAVPENIRFYIIQLFALVLVIPL